MTLIQNHLIYISVLLTIQFIAFMHAVNQFSRKPVARKLVIFIDGQRGQNMQNLKANKKYKLEVKGYDEDDNEVAIEGQVDFSLSNPESGAISTQEDGSVILDPAKVGPVAIGAKSGELVGSLECEVIAGDLFKINISATELP